ncbi:MAG: thrombospondin type 3 repeat-containing protein [Luteolibacter sp.]|nr:thrombospondin type 3 repeat-containing protein [Luteolibacter sp.]
MKSLPTHQTLIQALAAAAAVAIALPLSADIVPAPVNGDIFLGFRASGGQGGDSSYLVNLGPDTAFRNLAQGSSITFTVSGGTNPIGDIGADLAATYGADWNTRPDLLWGVFGLKNSSSPSVYSTRERTSPNTQSIPWPALNLSSRSSVASAASSVIDTNTGGYRGLQATANSPVAALQTNFSGQASYNFQVATPGTTDFGSLSQWSSIEGSFGGGVAATRLDFYWLSGSSTTPVKYLGYFSITGAGVLTFTNPSTTPPPNTDTDGDGQTDAYEAIAGTNPNDPADFFRVGQLVSAPGSPAAIHFQAAAGRNYQLQYSETLASWETIDTINGATAGALQFTDNDAVRRAKAKGFYRILVSQ